MADQSIKVLSKEELKFVLKEELKNCLLLSDQDKDFWLNNLENLPYGTLWNVFQLIHGKNQFVDKYINIALQQDQNGNYLKILKAEVSKIKNETFQLEDKTESQQTEMQLEQELNNL